LALFLHGSHIVMFLFHGPYIFVPHILQFCSAFR
jgi:hypothetical protein